MHTITLKQALEKATIELRYACERPRYEAELLLAYYLGKERTWIKMYDDRELEESSGYEALVARRAAHEPMEYITGRVSFYDIDLYSAPGALIPRPETEILVDKAAEIIDREGYHSIAEIGIGSGAISIVLARKFPQLQIVASDISREALEIAQTNIAMFGVGSQIALHHTSLLDGIEGEIEMIVSNPPYIAKHTPLAPNVAEYEPHTALYSEGQEGEALLHQIILLARERRVKYLACEMGYDQRASITAFVRETGGAYSLDFYQDLAGLDRGFVLQFFGEENGFR